MIRIVTDSAADLTAEQLSVPGIFVVPLSVTFADGTTQLDDGTMTKDEFFVRLAEDSKLPRTSQPSPASFIQVYEDAAAAGDEVLVITIGQKLSGTYQCAHLAAADVGLQVHIVDSEAASQAEALLVREAVRLRDEEGLTAEEIAAVLEQFKKRVRSVAVVDSLKHLQKGGRLPAAVALVGGALGIKPVLALQDGAIKLVDKGRGRPGALVAMFKQLDALGGIDPRYGYTLLYSDNKQLIAPVHHYMHQNLQLTGGRVAQLGPTIIQGAKLGRIRDHLDGLLIDMAKNLYSGRIDAEPLCTGGRSPCTYCEFRCACTHRDGEHERTISIKDDPFAE